MKEILQFRAWDGLSKTMSFWTMNDLCNHTDISDKPSCLDDWMQYSGLFDKHNVKIAEGDILKGTGMGNVVRVWEALSLNNFHHWQETEDLIDEHGDIEVVGHIYQNKELLDKKEVVERRWDDVAIDEGRIRS